MMPDGWSNANSGSPLAEVKEEKVDRPSDGFRKGMKVYNSHTEETFFIEAVRHHEVAMKLGTDRFIWFDIKHVEIIDDEDKRQEEEVDPSDPSPAEKGHH